MGDNQYVDKTGIKERLALETTHRQLRYESSKNMQFYKTISENFVN